MTLDDKNLDEITENMSEISPEVIARDEKAAQPSQAPKNLDPKNSAAAGKKDKRGRTFNPKIHEIDPITGQPRINRDGFLAIKPGRPKEEKSYFGGAPLPDGSAADAGADESAADKAAAVQNQNMAKITTALFFRLGVGVFGEEWLPRSYAIEGVGVISEQEEITAAFDQYFRAKGVKDLSPGWALVLSLSGYAAARMTQPVTQSKMQKLTNKAAHFFMKNFGKVKDFFKNIFKGAERGTQSDNRNDGKRQNYASPGSPSEEIQS